MEGLDLTYAKVLVLNQNYQPLNICNVRRALSLMGIGKAESIQNGNTYIRSISQIFPIPSVIRLFFMVKRPPIHKRMSRKAVFHRDKFTCQYCGDQADTLTLDHIMPRSRGGLHSWDNVVSACVTCNHRKAGLTLAEAHLKLKREPKAPRPNPYHIFQNRTIQQDWLPFIPWLV